MKEWLLFSLFSASPELCQEASSGEVFLLASAALANITFFDTMACEILLQLNAVKILLEACSDKHIVDTPYSRDQVRNFSPSHCHICVKVRRFQHCVHFDISKPKFISWISFLVLFIICLFIYLLQFLGSFFDFGLLWCIFCLFVVWFFFFLMNIIKYDSFNVIFKKKKKSCSSIYIRK